MKRLWLSSTLLLTAIGLCACGGGGSSSSGTTVTPPTAAAFVDQFGSSNGFGASFRVSANSDARDLAAGDVNSVSLTAEPVAFP